MSRNKKLTTLKKRLLDLSKRNQLMNFSSRVSSSLEFYQDDFFEFYQSFTNGLKFEVAKLFTNLDEEILSSDFDEVNDEYDVLNTVTNASGKMTLKKLVYTKEEIEDIKKRFKKSKNVNYLYSATIYSKSRNVLSLLKRKDKLISEETGSHSLYLAFGMIHYKDKSLFYDAPLCLVEAKIEQKKLNDKYIVSSIDDDFIVNENLSYFLKAEYNIDINRLSDEEFNNYIDRVIKLIEPLNFTYSDRIVLSIFSFNKIMMYKDIDLYEDKILENNIIKSFLCNNLSLDTNLDNLDTNIDTTLVLPYDSSQEKAVKLAVSGKSFVLQGPPGTGKSQTITNMLASLAKENKKVLFVCEKAEALEVVRNNLSKVKLDNLALCLYNTKASKQEVVKSIYSNIESIKDGTIKLNKSALNVIDKTNTYNDFFKELEYSLESVRIFDYTILDLIENSLIDGEVLDFKIDRLTKLSKEDYDKFLSNVDLISTKLIDLNDVPINSPFKGLLINNVNKKSLASLNDISFKLSNNLSKLLQEINSINSNLFKPKYFNEISSYLSLLELAKNPYNLSVSDFNHIDLEVALKTIKSIENFYKTFKSEKEYFIKKYDSSILDLDVLSDLSILKDKYNNALKRLIGYNKYHNKYSNLLLDKSYKLSYDELVLDLEKLINLNDTYSKFSQDEAIISSVFRRFYFGSKTDFNKLYNIIDYLDKYNKTISKLNVNQSDIIKELIKCNNYDLEISLINKIVKELNDLLNSFSNYFDISNITLDDLFIKSKNIYLNIDSIFKYLDLMKELNKMPKELDSLKECILNNNIDYTKLKNSFIKTISINLLDYYIEHDNFLSSLDNNYINSNLDKFIQFSNQMYEVSKIKTLSNVTKNYPHLNALNSSNLELATLLKELNKKKKLLSVRTLLSSISNLVLTLKPIFMMSPLAVATYLEYDKFKFDCVIFDEASQITLEDSIGAMSRANQIIIVGDKEQLPPTNFFSSDIEDEEYEDLESVLNVSSTILPSIMLNWHYRSKDESLIKSSNDFIYHNLTTIPSSVVSDELGVVYEYVENGIYEAIKTYNYKEAERVVDLLFYNIRHNSDKSIGIVTFNMKQQSLILSLINKQRLKNKMYEDFFNKDNNFFVKNLETVQGDEKDIIILSTTFGYNQNHKLNFNFGPINKEGGYRRLNVAITRARYKLIVVSSLDPSDLLQKQLTNQGQIFLYKFLNYAKNRQTLGFVSSKPVNNFIKTLGQNIEKYGYKVLYDVGINSYKLDLCILDKLDSNKIKTCILTESNNYFSLNSIKDRTVLITNLLKSSNFNVIYLDCISSINRIDSIVIDIVKSLNDSNSLETIDMTNNELDSCELFNKEEDSVLDVFSLFDPYPNIISIIEEESYLRNTLEDKLLDIVNKTSPIKIDELKKLIVNPFFNSNLNSDIDNRINSAINNLVKTSKAYKIIGYLLKPSDLIALRFRRFDSLNPYNRSIDNIYVEEIESGFLSVITYVKQTTVSLLFETFNILLGYPKNSKDTDRIFRRALNVLIDKEEVEVLGNIINMK